MSDTQQTSGGSSALPGRRVQWLALGLALAALAVALCALLHSMGLLPDLGAGGPADPEKIEVDAAAFRAYFTVEKTELGEDGRTLVLTLKRTKAFPLDDDDLDTLAEKTAKGASALLALEAVARGYVRCECFDAATAFLGFTIERIRGLAQHETLELAVPIAGRRGLSRVVLTY
ncbi:MAG TPA: hypothetical protein PLE19_21650 [Planctomycetota bacterium]|nr:hypothetical protein [Planctomycetota bacterium]HRR82149.1 hypothetical protein [Planctomycetota bacterium]